MFTGLSAFPLTPLRDDRVDGPALSGLVQRLASAGVDSITVLGSTGSYAYLDAGERDLVARTAVDQAGGTPVLVGIGDTRTSRVLAHAEAAQRAGAAGLLLAPVSYQPLSEDEVHGLFRAVTEQASVPVVVYDNPRTTRFTFTLEFYARIAELPGIDSIKIPPMAAGPAAAQARVDEVRAVLPDHVGIGISGDFRAADALAAGCDAWFSVLGGTIPGPALRIVRAVQRGDLDAARAESARLEPLWRLLGEHGSLRVAAALAEHLGLAPADCLPLPVLGLAPEHRAEVAAAARPLGLVTG
ncbi:MAG: dihydrodipicolinate synthase family protein [Citricoccus sp.]